MGRVIAEYCDYALAYQLIEDAYMESIGNGKRYTDYRFKIIEKHGMITPKDLAEAAVVSGSAISQWIKSSLKKGVLIWVDQEGCVFPDDKALEKAKRSGKAYIKVSQFNRLPTPYELTGNSDWDIEGKFFQQFDLGLESSTDTDVLDMDESDRSSSFLNSFYGSNEVRTINFSEGLDKIFSKGNVGTLN